MIQQVKTGNGIIQTDNVIISRTSRPLIKISHLFQGYKIENGYSHTGNGNISPSSRPLIKKRLL